MSKQKDDGLQTFIDNLTTRFSAIQSGIAVLTNRFIENVAAVKSRLMKNVATLTGSYTVLEDVLISLVTSTTIDVISEQLFRAPEEEDIRQRAQKASEYLTEAAKILGDLEKELGERTQKLECLLNEIEARQADAEHWKQVAAINELTASAWTKEIERRVRNQIRTEFDRGKNRRRVFGALGWLVTLFLGGIVGAAIQQWWQTGAILP